VEKHIHCVFVVAPLGAPNQTDQAFRRQVFRGRLIGQGGSPSHGRGVLAEGNVERSFNGDWP
jgi:hypothetical protein